MRMALIELQCARVHSPMHARDCAQVDLCLDALGLVNTYKLGRGFRAKGEGLLNPNPGHTWASGNSALLMLALRLAFFVHIWSSELLGSHPALLTLACLL